jgi:hypothetical protein
MFRPRRSSRGRGSYTIEQGLLVGQRETRKSIPTASCTSFRRERFQKMISWRLLLMPPEHPDHRAKTQRPFPITIIHCCRETGISSISAIYAGRANHKIWKWTTTPHPGNNRAKSGDFGGDGGSNHHCRLQSESREPPSSQPCANRHSRLGSLPRTVKSSRGN